jgi:hypothetical protein
LTLFSFAPEADKPATPAPGRLISASAALLNTQRTFFSFALSSGIERLSIQSHRGDALHLQHFHPCPLHYAGELNPDEILHPKAAPYKEVFNSRNEYRH